MECHRNCSLALWVTGCPGLVSQLPYLFNHCQPHEQSFIVDYGGGDHAPLHHLFLTSSFLPVLHPLLHDVQMLPPTDFILILFPFYIFTTLLLVRATHLPAQSGSSGSTQSRPPRQVSWGRSRNAHLQQLLRLVASQWNRPRPLRHSHHFKGSKVLIGFCSLPSKLRCVRFGRFSAHMSRPPDILLSLSSSFFCLGNVGRFETEIKPAFIKQRNSRFYKLSC